MRSHWSTRCLTRYQGMQEYSVFKKRVGAQAMVDALADTLTEVEAVTPGDTLGDAHALNCLVVYT